MYPQTVWLMHKLRRHSNTTQTMRTIKSKGRPWAALGCRETLAGST
jgi:hypothetical protein